MLTPSAMCLDWALKNVRKFGDTYTFPVPFEFEAIEEEWTEVRDHLLKTDILKYGIREYRTCLTPKSNLGFRVATQLDPLDSIIYNAIIAEIWEELEASRIPKEEGIVFSCRLQPRKDGTLYDPEYNWISFQAKAREMAESGYYSHVVVTDIADFFPSLYLHNIETCLRECVRKSGKSCHAEVLINAIKAMHLNQTHRGVPVGPQFPRPIAEITLTDIDRALLDEGITFIRFVDDFRVFCKSESDAYKSLAFLAQHLYDLRALKLNEHKTSILGIKQFLKRYAKSEEEIHRERIVDRFEKLLEEAGIEVFSYDPIVLADLDPSQREQLESLNLIELLQEELDRTPDLHMVSWLLLNLARVDNTEVAELILDDSNIRKTHSIIREVVKYLDRVRSFSVEQRRTVGARLIQVLNETFIGQLEAHRAWILYLFTKGREWDNEGAFPRLMKKWAGENFSKRKLLLALGRSKNLAFFRDNKNTAKEMESWCRRAFIAAISCLPEDERKPWYKARRLTHRDLLDEIVERWAEKHPF